MKLGNTTRFLSFVTIAIALIQLYFIHLIVCPITVIDINAPLVIENIDDVHAGDTVYYDFNYTKYHPYNCVVTRQLINEFIVTFPSTESNLPLGKKVVKQSLKIPKECRPGPHKLRGTLVYDVNFLRKIVYTVESPWFDVKPPRR